MRETLTRTLAALTVWLTLTTASVFAGPPARADLSTNRVLYTVGYAHLDTQWRWGYPRVISRYLPNTLWDNFHLFEEYPDYVFNFSGANRYHFIQEYFPGGFAQLREWVARGRWFPAGSSWEENDVNVPSTESSIRQLLYGQRFFQREFGVSSREYMLPDCFGFPASLPSVLAHCGLRGFSTAKLTWGSAVGIPFNLGVWEGLDGESVIAAFNPGKYDGNITEDLSASAKWQERLEANRRLGGIAADLHYYGIGDEGGAPREDSVQWIQRSVTNRGPVRVLSARADQLFNDITPEQRARLPRYQGDLLLTEHSAGSLTSQAYMKSWNRLNETLAEAAEKAAVAAHLLGATPYPRQKLNRAWELVLGAQFHDILPGTSLPKCYEYSWNDEVIAMNCFASVLQSSVGGVARALDTQVAGVPLVVFNPLSIEREDVVEAELDFHVGTAVQVFDGAGQPVPTQVLANESDQQAGKTRILFLARVPSVGFAVFSARETSGTGVSPVSASPLRVTDRSLENARYRVTVNDAGDLASVFDKTAQRELLAAPARLAFLHEMPREWPAWNMDWQDRTNAPRAYLSGPAKIRVVEDGPVRVALEVGRESEDSILTQTIRLAAGAAGNRVEIANHVDWQSRSCSLKAEFPLTVANPKATYNWELGKIQRGNNDPKKYEVPSRQWFDLTDARGDYGVTILAPAKYGSDKPADHLLRLTLLYTPGVRENGGYQEQKYQDWGRHDFVYGLSGHVGDWRTGKADWEAARLGQPMFVFRAPAHAGKLGRAFSLLQTSSDQVMVGAVKLAEDNDRVIVRVQELNGALARGVTLATAAGLRSASAVNGLELEPKRLPLAGQALALDFKPYQLRSLACTLRAPAKLAPPTTRPVELPFNLDAFSFNDLKQDGAFDGDGATMPAEMIGDQVLAEGITFRIGPRENGRRNAVACRGQRVELPAGNFDRLHLLACSINGDADGEFRVNDRPHPLHVQDWSAFLGSWDNRVFEGHVPEVSFSINNRLERIATGYIKRAPLAWFCSHRHQRAGNDQIYTYSYLFKYTLPLPTGAKTLTLPQNPRIRIFAATVAHDEADDLVPVHPLYDDFTSRKSITLRAQP